MEGEGAAPKAKSRHKAEGAFYTCAFVTRYIVEHALGGVLKERFERLRQRHAAEVAGTAKKAPAEPDADDLAALKEPSPRPSPVSGKPGRTS